MITIITGTNRLNSNSSKVSETYSNILNNKGIKSQILNLKKLNSQFISEDMYGKRTPKTEMIIEKYIDNVNQFIFVIPEYNGTYPGVLKMFMDGVSPSKFHYKKATLVGVASGRAGNIVGLEHFTTVLNHLKMEVLSNKVLLSQIEELLDEEGLVGNETSLEIIEEQLELMNKIFEN